MPVLVCVLTGNSCLLEHYENEVTVNQSSIKVASQTDKHKVLQKVMIKLCRDKGDNSL